MRFVITAILVVLFGLGASSHALAQTEDYSAASEPRERRSLVQQQLGYPGIFSTRLLFPIGGNHRLGPAVTFLPEMTGIGGEYRLQLSRPRVERFSVHMGGGSTYYYITENSRSTSMVGGHVYFGTLYRTRSNLAMGADLGYVATSGSDGGIRSFKIEKGLSSAYVNFSIAYLF